MQFNLIFQKNALAKASAYFEIQEIIIQVLVYGIPVIVVDSKKEILVNL